MSDNQNKGNSFSGINLKDAASIGIIGGVFQAPNNLLLKEKYHNWVEECANIIRPCSHTIAETIDFFLQQCDAIPVKEDDHRIKGYGYSVIMNYFQDKLNDRASNVSPDRNDTVLKVWHRENNNIQREIVNASLEHFGVKIHGFYLPQTERNSYLYDEIREEMEKILRHKNDLEVNKLLKDMFFFFEETTEDIQCNNGGRSLINKLFVYRGVREEDIILRNPRFHQYLSSMSQLGGLSDFR